MFKLVLGKTEEPEIKLPTSAGSWKKQKSSRKTSISALLTMPKPLTVWITIDCGKFFKKIKRFQGNISCKDGLNKGQKWYGLTEAEDIKKRWQEYTEELYKKRSS